MKNSFFAGETCEAPTFENTINDIKDIHMKSITYAATNPSDITSFDDNFDPLCIKNSFEAAKFEPEPKF